MRSNLDPDELTERIYRIQKMTWNQGAEAERERIMKLLEEQVCPDSFCAHDLCLHTLQIIELVKGE